MTAGGKEGKMENLKALSYDLRKNVVDMIMEGKGGHIGGDMSVLDVMVPEGSIYVLGDNRNNSSDSRHVALSTVDTRYVLGRALWVVFPLSSFGAIQ